MIRQRKYLFRRISSSSHSVPRLDCRSPAEKTLHAGCAVDAHIVGTRAGRGRILNLGGKVGRSGMAQGVGIGAYRRPLGGRALPAAIIGTGIGFCRAPTL
ncbi:hypothetical protein EUGRSUZ_I02361 [Eucalyptus grandis]|uniref:Uncharacterized protein n=2 Tax=Eucalyptus grandis TaxID=71139 RepID=A0ACC3JID4_EUCGR|nr:hypothetical protein EUGRSUZ_I02361 [Eucalyptus grandis]